MSGFKNSKELEENEAAKVPAWEMVAAGRYMPRRIRGSLRGRELG
jgi:uroporphyrinogen-III decarboxylase